MKRYSLTARQAAVHLGLPLRTLYHLVATRQIEHLRTHTEQRTRRRRDGRTQSYTGGQLRFAPEDLEAWVERQRVPVAPRYQVREARVHHVRLDEQVVEPLPLPATRRFA